MNYPCQMGDSDNNDCVKSGNKNDRQIMKLYKLKIILESTPTYANINTLLNLEPSSVNYSIRYKMSHRSNKVYVTLFVILLDKVYALPNIQSHPALTSYVIDSVYKDKH